MSRNENLRTGERGDDTVTGVVIFSVLMIVGLTIFQLVAVFLGRTIALEAARDGADQARLPPVDLAAAAQGTSAYARGAAGTWLSNVDVGGTSNGRLVSITVNADVASFVPFVFVRISETASAPIERIQP